jgi:hypothetical protein
VHRHELGQDIATMRIATHNLDLARRLDRIVALEG